MPDPTPTSILLDIATDIGELSGKVDSVIAEQARAADRRSEVYEKVAAVERNVAVAMETIKDVPQLEARVRELERERDQAKGAVAVVRLQWIALASVAGAIVTYVLTKLKIGVP